ncbi:hypothetical protein [Nonomuraea jiangxiensis]|uniref:hypothetical protein n=1 Tax=Nonomuraea jiangxiensis TaxID=633440 RepID=UPI00115FE195|nr:hypothetical protein [Nonomuraea jiangxiensis]
MPTIIRAPLGVILELSRDEFSLVFQLVKEIGQSDWLQGRLDLLIGDSDALPVLADLIRTVRREILTSQSGETGSLEAVEGDPGPTSLRLLGVTIAGAVRLEMSQYYFNLLRRGGSAIVNSFNENELHSRTGSSKEYALAFFAGLD